MPWTSVNFTQNTHVTGIGTVTALHDSGFSYSEFAVEITTSEGRDKFITNAKAAFTEKLNKESAHSDEKTDILTKLNL